MTRIDTDTADRDTLIAEIHRLTDSNERWRTTWHTVRDAYISGWSTRMAVLEKVTVETSESLTRLAVTQRLAGNEMIADELDDVVVRLTLANLQR